ncbi:hypothetical protein [Streptomyces sp. NPDC059894]|uniref:MmyB family transcriptional regulator n=1 Tax=unclassified Streptomyces TaxID=2593676 RepID=UPI00365076A7
MGGSVAGAASDAPPAQARRSDEDRAFRLDRTADVRALPGSSGPPAGAGPAQPAAGVAGGCLVFTDPYVRDLLPDWETTSRRFLAELRAEAGPRLGDLARSPAVQRLLDTSETFRAAWQDHRIEGFTSRPRVFHHPAQGVLRCEHHRLAPADHPDLHVVVYTWHRTRTPTRGP